jgi:hypothetical protein
MTLLTLIKWKATITNMKFNELANSVLKEGILPYEPGTIEEMVKGYYKLLTALRSFVKQNPEYAYNEDALKSTDIYQEFDRLVQDELFQKLITCGVESYMYGDMSSILQDVIKGN